MIFIRSGRGPFDLERFAEIDARVAAGLTKHAAEYADVVAPLFGSDAGITAGDHGKLQDWLLEAIGRVQFETYVLGPLLARRWRGL